GSQWRTAMPAAIVRMTTMPANMRIRAEFWRGNQRDITHSRPSAISDTPFTPLAHGARGKQKGETKGTSLIPAHQQSVVPTLRLSLGLSGACIRNQLAGGPPACSWRKGHECGRLHCG